MSAKMLSTRPTQLKASRMVGTRSVPVVVKCMAGGKYSNFQMSAPATALLSLGLAAGMTCSSMFFAPKVEAGIYKSLADTVCASYSFMDYDKDGVVTKEELEKVADETRDDLDFVTPPPSQIDYSMKLWDLNQDGVLAIDEVLVALALNTAKGEFSLNPDVWQVFDKNGDNKVDKEEFDEGFGDLGEGGPMLKDYVFKRVSALTESQALSEDDFAQALGMVRAVVLGY